MRKLVQLRGVPGSGKTTCMRNLIERLGGSELYQVRGASKNRPVMRADGWVILGDYTKDGCAGCDRFDDKKDLIAVLRSVIAEKPDNIALEGMIYSQTFLLAAELDEIARKNGYQYVPVFLNTSFETALGRVMVRNGGKQISEDGLMKKALRFSIAREKIRRAGMKLVEVNTDNLSSKQVAERVFEAIL